MRRHARGVTLIAAAAIGLAACQPMDLSLPAAGSYTATDPIELRLPPSTSRLHVTAVCQQNPEPGRDVAFDLEDPDGKRVQGALCHGTVSDPGQAPVDGWTATPTIRFLYGTVGGPASESVASATVSIIITVEAYDANGQFLGVIL